MRFKQREETVNILFAQILSEMGVASIPEILISSYDRTRQIPDILLKYKGLRVVIEGKYEDSPNSRKKVTEQIRNRILNGIAHIGIAIIYPSELRNCLSVEDLKNEIYQMQFDIKTYSEAGEKNWSKCTVNGLVENLNRTYDILLQEDIIGEITAIIENGIEYFSFNLLNRKEIIKKCAELIGYSKDHSNENTKKAHEYNESIGKISGLTLFNAMIFQDVLSNYREEINSLRFSLSAEDPVREFIEHWKFIINEIDFVPIFKIARNILLSLPVDANIMNSISFLGEQTIRVLSKRAALNHDIMGRVYHKLLSDAKYLGTYYTSIPAAALLLKLTLMKDRWLCNWSDYESISKLKAGDLASGTGTLLLATTEALIDNYIQKSYEDGEKIDLSRIHKILIENVIYGYDVLASAIHLTASTLSLRSSCIEFKDTNLYSLPFGGESKSLGSIDFIENRQVNLPFDIFRANSHQITGSGTKEHFKAPLPDLDLCVMNPPFTRSVGGNLLFGSVPDKERSEMQTKLKAILKNNNISANATAGLGAVFIAIGDMALKMGGRLSLVLPKTILSGSAWEKTRRIFRDKYRLEWIIVSHDPLRWNFSDSTDLSETMLVAQKIGGNNNNNNHNVKVVNLWHNPETVFEALVISWQLEEGKVLEISEMHGAAEIAMGHKKIGETLSFKWDELKNNSWMIPVSFAQSELVKTIYNLYKGQIYIPGYGFIKKIDICKLSDLGLLGFDGRDIHDAFEFSETRTEYPAYWGHDSQKCFKIRQRPNGFLKTLSKAKKGRNLRKATDLWKKSGKLLISAVSRVNTQRTFCVLLNAPVLSNVWWSFNPHNDDDNLLKPLSLWLNSSLGIMSILSQRGETEGAWIKLRKPNIEAVPVPDLRKLKENQLRYLNDVFDSICNENIDIFPNMRNDSVRKQIDQAIAEILGAPDFNTLRTLLAQEPVVCLKKLE